MSLPKPLPDNPTRWDGWKNYNSSDLYARLCLDFDTNPSAEQIEENCRQLLVWWQKKLPLKNQPSNPVSQMLRGGLDEAPQYLAEARSVLLDPSSRAQHDKQLHAQAVQSALDEFKKLLAFAIDNKRLRAEDEQRLYERGSGLGLNQQEMLVAIDADLTRLGAERVAAAVISPAATAPPSTGGSAVATGGGEPFSEFRRLLQMSRLCLEGEEMTDDQRDAMCNLGESLGLSGGQAEDLIDEYLEAVSAMPVAASPSPVRAASVTAVAPTPVAPSGPSVVPQKKPEPSVPARPPVVSSSPLSRSQERISYPNFKNSAGLELLLVTSGSFVMGSAAPEAQPHEQPLTPVALSCFYLARFPVTNAQYERFDPTHRIKRAPWANDVHPVVYVSSREAEKFCAWLSAKEGKRYRLPTEAEWEYAARGNDGRIFPWGGRLDAGNLVNFADRNTSFPWREESINDGFAETSPVGSYPKGASPFGMEDLAGNVFEWCLDLFEPYKGKERVNPRGSTGAKRSYRGGSWRSRANSLRTTARAFNLPDYSSNDVGFRIVCECGPA